MAYEGAVEAGLFMAELSTNVENARNTAFSAFTSAPSDTPHKQRPQRTQSYLSRLDATKATNASTVGRVTQKAQRKLETKLHKLSRKKWMRPVWKNLHRMRRILHFNPEQMRQFILGMAFTLHVFTNYSKRGGQVHSDLKKLFFLVFVPFSIPPMMVLGVPLLMSLTPIMILWTAFSGLNRQAKWVQEQQRQQRLKQQAIMDDNSHKSFMSRSMQSIRSTVFPRYAKNSKGKPKGSSSSLPSSPSTNHHQSTPLSSSSERRTSFLRSSLASPNTPRKPAAELSLHDDDLMSASSAPALISSEVSNSTINNNYSSSMDYSAIVAQCRRNDDNNNDNFVEDALLRSQTSDLSVVAGKRQSLRKSLTMRMSAQSAPKVPSMYMDLLLHQDDSARGIEGERDASNSTGVESNVPTTMKELMNNDSKKSNCSTSSSFRQSITKKLMNNDSKKSNSSTTSFRQSIPKFRMSATATSPTNSTKKARRVSFASVGESLRGSSSAFRPASEKGRRRRSFWK